jgi:internalin A
MARLLQQRPEVKLRVFGYDSFHDLTFLRFFPGITRFQCDVYHLRSLAGSECLPADLEMLGLGQTKHRKLSLAFLRRFTQLKELYLEGQQYDIEVISELLTLKNLELRSVSLPDLSLLRPLRNLESFALKLGRTIEIDDLATLPRLRYLEIWLVKTLCDVDVISELTHLDTLFLQALPRVESLPSLKKLSRLQKVTLHAMKGLRDMKPLAQAPSLRELHLIDARHMQPADLLPLKQSRSLRTIGAGLGSRSKGKAAAESIQIPGEYGGYEVTENGEVIDHWPEAKRQLHARQAAMGTE